MAGESLQVALKGSTVQIKEEDETWLFVVSTNVALEESQREERFKPVAVVAGSREIDTRRLMVWGRRPGVVMTKASPVEFLLMQLIKLQEEPGLKKATQRQRCIHFGDWAYRSVVRGRENSCYLLPQRHAEEMNRGYKKHKWVCNLSDTLLHGI